MTGPATPPRGDVRAYVIVLAIATSITTAKGTVEIVYPPYLYGYDYSLSLIGLLSSLISGVQLLSRIPAGVAYRAHRAKRVYAVSLVFFCLSISGFAFADGNALAVSVLSALHGLTFGILGTMGLALAIDVAGGRPAGVSMAWYTAALSTGYALGSLIGGSLAETIGMPATLGLVGLLPLVAGAAVFALPPIEGAAILPDRGAGIRGVLGAARRLDSRVWLAVIIVLYINLIQDSLDTFFPVFAPTVGISLAVVGVMRAVKSGAGIFMRFAVAIVLHRVDYRALTFAAVLASSIGLAAVPLSTSVVVVTPVFAILGLTRGVLRATSAATIADLRTEGRDVGLASGVYSMGLDVGGIVGPIVGGGVASVIGIGPMFQVVALGSLVAWLVVALSTPATRAASVFAKRHTIGPTTIAGGAPHE